MKPHRAWILAQHEQGNTRDTIYQNAVILLGLWGIAFYGHKGTRNERAALSRTWKRILKYTGV